MFPLAGMYRGQPPGTVIPNQLPPQTTMPVAPGGMTGQPPMVNAPMQPVPTGAPPPTDGTPMPQATPGIGSGVNSPLFRALMMQRMSAANGSTPQASGIGALGQASNPVAGALMAQRMGLLK